MRARGFTIMEMLIVLVVATILTSIGMVGMSQVIKEARYRSDRARLYMDIKDQRDRAKSGMHHLIITEIGPAGVNKTQVEYRLGLSCGAVFPTDIITVVDYPSIDHFGDRVICNSSFDTVQFLPVGPPPAVPFIDFLPLGGGPSDTIGMEKDASLLDSWNEFPDEGCLEANPAGDPDSQTDPCG